MRFPRTVTVAATLLAAPVVALAAAALGSPALGDPDRPEPERLTTTVDRWRERADVAGVVAVVRGPDGASWTTASGRASRSPATAMTPAASFRVASITKMFVAVVVLQLAAEGRLGLDDRVSAHLPGVAALQGITVRQLLGHTSGLPDYIAVDEDFLRDVVDDRDRRWTAGELVATATSVRRDFAPGTDYAYSNTGFVVLGMVVEAVTGTPWPAQVRRRILDPLGLTHTYVAGAETGPPVVAGYHDADDDGDRENVETGRPWTSLETSEGAAGALVSTAADLAAFADALFHGRLLDRPSQQAMTRETAFHPRVGNYGLGLEVARPDYTTTVWGHGGFVIGFRSTLWYVPEQDRIIVVLANDSLANSADLAELLLRAAQRRPGGS